MADEHDDAGRPSPQDWAERERGKERLRIAAWLHAKSDETEALLLLAADRAAPESRAVNQAFATKTRVILEVLARMIEKNVLPLTDRKAKGDA